MRIAYLHLVKTTEGKVGSSSFECQRISKAFLYKRPVMQRKMRYRGQLQCPALTRKQDSKDL